MIPPKIEHVFIELCINYVGIITEIVAGKFAFKHFRLKQTIFNTCPFLEGTIDAIKVNESFTMEGMLIAVDSEEYHVDVELFKSTENITVLIHNRTNVYQYVDQLNQNRNDLFFLKRELAESNEELAKQKQIAEKANQAKSRFLAMMSHEVRNPLNVILGYTELINKENLSEKVKEYTKYLTISGKNLKVIVDDILDLSRVEAGKLVLANESINLKDVIHQIENNYQNNNKEKAVKITFSYSETLPKRVFGDDVRLYQILTNLINNSIKFTQKGTVKISAKLVSMDEEIAQIRFAVADTGRGMTKEQALKVFDEYQQNSLDDNRVHKGAGLGLSIVKRLVGIMNGSVCVESKLNVGTTFFVDIPFEIDNSEIPKEKEFTGSQIYKSLKSKKILVADDNYLNLSIVSHILTKEEADFKLVRDGVEALSEMQKTIFDIILLDINMPNLSGDALMQQNFNKQQKNSRTPVLALTANSTQEDKDWYTKIGFSGIIAKPFSAKEFVEKLQRVLG